MVSSSKNRFQPTHTPFGLGRYGSAYEKGRTAIIEQLLPSGAHKSAIDIACGPGYFCQLLATKGWRTTAVDTDADNLRKAAIHTSEVHLGDAISVLSKLPENHYDLALALEIIEHMPKSLGASLLKNIERVLRPGGTLIVSTPNKFSPEGWGHYYWGEKIRGWGKWYAWDTTHVHIYSSREFIRALKTNGFALDSVTGYHYQGILPLIGEWKLPLEKSTMFPFNRFGFNVIVACHKRC